MRRLLLERFPALRDALPWMALADLPTPVQPAAALGRAAGVGEIWVKRDDLSATLYGGNKPRKLELLLADASRRGCREVVAIGADGSNHCVAVGLFARQLGLDFSMVTLPQPPLPGVRRNILVARAAGARMVHAAGDVALAPVLLAHVARRWRQTGRLPYVMWFGGSTPLGTIGFVEAALELAAQVEAGVLPAPDAIFLPVGSGGSHAGLEVGLRLAGLSTRVIGVRVAPRIVANATLVAALATWTARLLRSHARDVPRIRWRPCDVTLLDTHIGPGYGRPTAAGQRAVALARETEGLGLDPTYTGKAMAGMLDWLRSHGGSDATALFWLTYNSRDLDGQLASAPDPATLPPAYRRYFTAGPGDGGP